MYFPFGKSIHIEEFNMVVYYWTVCYLREKLSRDLGSPGRLQLLQLQLFSQFFFKFWTLLLIFILPNIVWIAELCFCFPSATNLDCLKLKWGQLLSCFSENCFLSANALTMEFWKWCLIGLNDFLQRYQKSIYVRVRACFSLLSLFWKINELISSLPSLNILST